MASCSSGPSVAELKEQEIAHNKAAAAEAAQRKERRKAAQEKKKVQKAQRAALQAKVWCALMVEFRASGSIKVGGVSHAVPSLLLEECSVKSAQDVRLQWRHLHRCRDGALVLPSFPSGALHRGLYCYHNSYTLSCHHHKSTPPQTNGVLAAETGCCPGPAAGGGGGGVPPGNAPG